MGLPLVQSAVKQVMETAQEMDKEWSDEARARPAVWEAFLEVSS